MAKKFNELMRSGGFMSRELVTGQGRGFVLHIADTEHKPPKVDTVVLQPGQDSVTVVTTQVDIHEHPESSFPVRLTGGQPLEPTSPEDIITSIADRSDLVATIAVRHLSEM